MIIFDRDTKTLEIPAGLGNLEIVITSGASRYGVSSLNGQKGDLTLKTVNGNAILGSGDIVIEGGARIVNFDEMTKAQRAQLFAELLEKWNSGETINDKYIFLKFYSDFGPGTWVNIQFIFRSGYLYFGNTLPNPIDTNRVVQFDLALGEDGVITQARTYVRIIPTKTSEITNNSGFVNSAQTAQQIATATQDMVTKNTVGTTTFAQQIWTGTQAEYDALETHSNNILYFING